MYFMAIEERRDQVTASSVRRGLRLPLLLLIHPACSAVEDFAEDIARPSECRLDLVDDELLLVCELLEQALLVELQVSDFGLQVSVGDAELVDLVVEVVHPFGLVSVVEFEVIDGLVLCSDFGLELRDGLVLADQFGAERINLVQGLGRRPSFGPLALPSGARISFRHGAILTPVRVHYRAHTWPYWVGSEALVAGLLPLRSLGGQ